MSLRKYFFLIILAAAFKCNFNAALITKAYKALEQYDYFKAKKLFYKTNKKRVNPFASYGLSVIFMRNDNPFHNLDSASKYAALSYQNYIFKEKSFLIQGFKIDSVAIVNLIDTIAHKAFELCRKINTVSAYNHFLECNYLAGKKVLNKAVLMRDELEFNTVQMINFSTFTQAFINTHPQSVFLKSAVLLFETQIYVENTKSESAAEYIAFLKKYPNSGMVIHALEKLFYIFKNERELTGLNFFVNTYPAAPQSIEAWKLLFSRSVKSFNSAELQNFLSQHPNCPLKNSILKELELNELKLIKFQKNDFTGFLDTLGEVVIQPVYDACSSFVEGLAVVTKNDSVYFINKRNQNIFEEYFNEAYPFNNGVTAVKKNSHWHFINRQGQQILDILFDEVNELSNNCYVVKQNGLYGALDIYGNSVIETKFEKLGDFKNDYAYYIKNGKYGFITKYGRIYKASYDWVSDMGNDSLAIIKLNNKFGLLNTNDSIVLLPEFDLVVRAKNGIFILVKDNLYGFYSGTFNCFLSQINWDYLKEKPSDFYTNGNLLKLIKNTQQAFVDLNGRVSIDFGLYDELNFASCNLIRVKRKRKYGFLDRKLNPIIQYKYAEATDFRDSLSTVKLKDKNCLISLEGKEVFTSEYEIEKIGHHYYLIHSPEKILINNKGEVVIEKIETVQKTDENSLIITLINGRLKLIKD